MSLEDWKNLTAGIQAAPTAASLVVGGIWVYRRYVKQEERYPHIEFVADIKFVGKQGAYWIVELVAEITNKGKVQHCMEKFRFDLNGLFDTDPLTLGEEWGNQVHFPRKFAEGSFLPSRMQFFFVAPGTSAKYSHITCVPEAATFVILHSWFEYLDKRKFHHSAERTVRVPKEEVRDPAPNSAC